LINCSTGIKRFVKKQSPSVIPTRLMSRIASSTSYTLDFPAIRMGVRRGQKKADLVKSTGRAPRFSMCKICPFKTPERWAATPERELPSVYEVDEAIRDMSRVGITEGDCFLTNRLIPVEQLIKRGDPQPFLPGLDSYCDGGACFL
jgi:hypothetical protein